MNILKTHDIFSLSDRAEISFIFNRGKKLRSKFGFIYVMNIPQDHPLKIAILFKKNCGNAVKRNYIKRIIRHFIRENITLFKGMNRVIFLYKYQNAINYDMLIKEYNFVLKNL